MTETEPHTHPHPHPHPHPDAEPHAEPDSEIGIPPLLRAARGSYGQAIRHRLSLAGFDDLPRNSAYVLGGMANYGNSAGDLVRQLGVSKQAASQLIDTLVLRGYLERETNADDRRRLTIRLTERGRAAGAAIRAGVVSVDDELAGMITPTEMAGLRAGLLALIDIRERLEDETRAESWPG